MPNQYLDLAVQRFGYTTVIDPKLLSDVLLVSIGISGRVISDILC